MTPLATSLHWGRVLGKNWQGNLPISSGSLGDSGSLEFHFHLVKIFFLCTTFWITYIMKGYRASLKVESPKQCHLFSNFICLLFLNYYFPIFILTGWMVCLLVTRFVSLSSLWVDEQRDLEWESGRGRGENREGAHWGEGSGPSSHRWPFH